MGAIEGDAPVSDNDWETVTKGGDAGIEKWIKNQFYGKSCAVVLIGSDTAGRKWINFEIEYAWQQKKGVVGVAIHGLKNKAGLQSWAGDNPFTYWTIDGTSLSSIVKVYTPPTSDSKEAYGYIKDNIEAWADEAVTIRNGFK
jgi:hypothetical protein